MRPLSFAVGVLFIAGCAPVFVPTLEPVDTVPMESVVQLASNGFARDATTGELTIFAMNGSMQRANADGSLLADELAPELDDGEGFPRRIADAAWLGDDQYVLVSDEDGHIWDRTTGRLEQRFCVAPAIGPSEWQENGGVAVDVEQNIIAAAPRFIERKPDPFGQPWETINERVEQSLRIYRFTDGELQSSADLAHVEDVQGLAIDGDMLWVATSTRLLAMNTDGDVRSTFNLGETEAARGLARTDSSIWVIDEFPVIVRRYDLADAR